MSARPESAGKAAEATGAARRPWFVLVFGPGVEAGAGSAATRVHGATVLSADDALVYEARFELRSASNAPPSVVVARALEGAAPARGAGGLLARGAHACVFLPDPDHGAAVRNRRALQQWIEALRPHGCSPETAPWFVADEGASVGSFRADILPPGGAIRALLPGADFVDAARAAVAVLAGERGEPEPRPGGAARRSTRRDAPNKDRPSRRLELVVLVVLVAAFLSALAAALA